MTNKDIVDIFSFQDYHSYLRAVFALRLKNNPRYSIRAFAKHLDLSAGFVSLLLSGKKMLSATSALQIANILKLGGRQTDYFVLMLQKETAFDPIKQAKIVEKMQVLAPRTLTHFLPVDSFQSIADWYHTTILELCTLWDGHLEPQKIADTLGIEKVTAQVALDRLLRLELLTVDCHDQDHKKYQRTQKNVRIECQESNYALQQFHKEMLTRAIASVDEQTPQEKFIGSETLAIDPAILPEAADILEDAFQKILALNRQKSKQKKNVYHLGIQFFRLLKQSPQQRAPRA